MARLSRLALAGLPHLARIRALPPARLCEDDTDREQLLASLRASSDQHGLQVHAYALGDSDIVLLATPAQATSLGRTIQDLGRRYAGPFNRRHGRTGPLWDGRFRATVLQPGEWVLRAMVHVERPALLPISETREPAEPGPWSSAAHHLGRRRDPLVATRAEYWALGNTPFERESAYRRLLDEGVSAPHGSALDEAMHKGWALGDGAFIDALAATAGRPLRPRPRGRRPAAARAHQQARAA